MARVCSWHPKVLPCDRLPRNMPHAYIMYCCRCAFVVVFLWLCLGVVVVVGCGCVLWLCVAAVFVRLFVGDCVFVVVVVCLSLCVCH